jgi:hypothetical protein
VNKPGVSSGYGEIFERDTFQGFDDEPLSLNRYVYTENNPILNIDPNSRFSWRLAKIGFWHISLAVWNLFNIVWGWQLNIRKRSVRWTLGFLASTLLISAETFNVITTLDALTCQRRD